MGVASRWTPSRSWTSPSCRNRCRRKQPPTIPAPTCRPTWRPFEGRIYILLLDDLHTASARTQFVRTAAREFVERTLHPGDLAAVLHVSAPAGASQDFTSDHRLLLASIDRFVGRKIRSGTLNEIDEYNRSAMFGRAPVKGDDPDASARANNADVVFTMIGRLARQVSTIRTRRKVLLWFSEGVDVEMPQRTGTEPWAGQRGAASAEQARARDRALEAMSIATRSDLIVYGIDPRGLRGADVELSQVGSIASDPTLGPGASTLHQETLRDQTTLRSVSEYTGGFAVVNTSQFGAAFERILDENSSYYMLGYYPANRRRDGKFRKIDVRVNRPGVKVRARRGYLAPSGKEKALGGGGVAGAPAQLQDALTRPVPYPGLGMAVQAAVFRSRGALASVLVTIQYAAGTFRRSAVESADKLAVSVVAMDPGGSVRGSDHRTIEFDVSPKTRQALETLGFRTFSRLELPAGRYQLRVASVLGSPGDVGSMRYDLEVPDFSRELPNMSSLVVTSRVAALIPTAGKDERLQEFLPAPPTTLRDFGLDDTLAFCAEMYEDSAKAGSPMPLEAIVEDEQGRVVGPVRDMQALPSPRESPGTSVYQLQHSADESAAGRVRAARRHPCLGRRDACNPAAGVSCVAPAGIAVGRLAGRPDCGGCRRGGERGAGPRNGRCTDQLRMGGALEPAAPQTDGPDGHLRQYRWSWRCSWARGPPPATAFTLSAPGRRAIHWWWSSRSRARRQPRITRRWKRRRTSWPE